MVGRLRRSPFGAKGLFWGANCPVGFRECSWRECFEISPFMSRFMILATPWFDRFVLVLRLWSTWSFSGVNAGEHPVILRFRAFMFYLLRDQWSRGNSKGFLFKGPFENSDLFFLFWGLANRRDQDRSRWHFGVTFEVEKSEKKTRYVFGKLTRWCLERS